MSEITKKVPKRIAQTVLNSLKGGVVPRIGLGYITVGRRSEIEALLRDVELIKEGGASFRFVVGRYGSGKSFLLQTIRNYVMDRGFVVADADLSPERRLQGTRGQGLATYRELMQNLSTKTRPEGGALGLVLDRLVMNAGEDAERKLRSMADSLGDMLHGYELTEIIGVYCRAAAEDDADRKAKALRWLRGEYATKREAKEELGVNAVITDDDWYDYLKLFAVFFRLAGYEGLMIFIDELVNIYKIPNSITRQYNYEKMLTMYNDAMQGRARYLGVIMGATPQAVEDKRRGVYSYEALRSRLTEGKFSRPGVRDLLAPVIRLEPLSAEEMLVLCEKLGDMHADLYSCPRRITTEELAEFIKLEFSRIGADSNITPREVIRDFIELIDLVYQHGDMSVAAIMGSEEFRYSESGAVSDEAAEDFAEFTV